MTSGREGKNITFQFKNSPTTSSTPPPPMHPCTNAMQRPMHSPACPSSHTSIRPHLTKGHQSYMILLLLFCLFCLKSSKDLNTGIRTLNKFFSKIEWLLLVIKGLMFTLDLNWTEVWRRTSFLQWGLNTFVWFLGPIEVLGWRNKWMLSLWSLLFYVLVFYW